MNNDGSDRAQVEFFKIKNGDNDLVTLSLKVYNKCSAIPRFGLERVGQAARRQLQLGLVGE